MTEGIYDQTSPEGALAPHNRKRAMAGSGDGRERRAGPARRLAD